MSKACAAALACAIAASVAPQAVFAAATLGTVSMRDGAETISNPGCGLAGGGWSGLTPSGGGMVELCGSSANCTKLWSMHKFSKGYVYKDEDYFKDHIEKFVGGADIPLTDAALLAVSNSLLSCRRNGGTCIPRFAYTWDGYGGAEPDDFSTILTHIRQLGEVLSLFRDVVPAVECGIVGAYGEMHTSRYAAAAYQNEIIQAWLDSLPGDMALLVRSPPAWMRYLGTTTAAFFSGGMDALDPALRSRMGFYNDGYLGTDGDYGTWGSGGTVNWVREQGRRFLRGHDVPYGGEFATVSETYFDSNVHLLDPARFNIVAEWYDTHLSYLRTIRSSGMTVYRKLAATAFDSATWAFDGMPDLSEYDGIDLRRFCEDHMGFRFVVRSAEYRGGANEATLALEIENTGFGRLLFDETSEILLDSEVESCAIDVGEIGLRSIGGGETAAVEIPFRYPKALAPGRYEVSLRVRAPLADEDGAALPRRPVRFANEGCWDDAERANRICTVVLDNGLDITPDNLWFSFRNGNAFVYGGRWAAQTMSGEMPVHDFEIAHNAPRRTSAVVEMETTVAPFAAIPEPDGGAASLVFLKGRDGGPVAWGWAADGWHELHGAALEEGRTVKVRLAFSAGRVSYSIDGILLRDACGAGRFASPMPLEDVSRVSFLGGDTVEAMKASLAPDAASPTVIMLK